MVRFKGTPYGVKLVLDPAKEGEALVRALEEALAEHQSFLAGSALDIDLGRLPLAKDVVSAIFDALARFPAIRIASISSGAHATTSLSARRRSTRGDGDTLIHYGTVRSGQVVSARGNLVVVGDVNHGGEVRAGRDIVVTGVLRGIAHAGQNPAEQRATIYAHRLCPVQLRIGRAIATPAQDLPPPDHPEMAWLEGGVIVVGPVAEGILDAKRQRAAGLPRRTSVNL